MTTLIPVWPAGFLPTPDAEGWDGSPFESRVAFQPESGPPLFRRRVTGETWQFSGRFPLVDSTEAAAFWAFWAEIDEGARPFLWRDPLDDQIRKWMFAAATPVKLSGVSDTHRDYQLSLIRLASTPWWAALMPPGPLVAPVAAYDLARGLYHNGVAQVGASAAISPAPGIIRAHGLSDVRLLTAAGAATVLLAQTLTSGWWPPSPPVGLASITIFASGALA